MRLEDQQNAGDALAPQGIAVALVSLGSLSCLVLVTIVMGLKLLKFRRQMRLGRFSQSTAATSAKMDMAASITNVPSQGVFRMWSISEEGPPDPPPPPVRVNVPTKTRPTRPKTMESPAAKPKPEDKKVRPQSLGTATVNEMGVDVVGLPSPSDSASKQPKNADAKEKLRPKSFHTSKSVMEVGVDLPSPPITPSKTKSKKEKVDKKSRPKSLDTSKSVTEVGVDLPSPPVTPSKTKSKKEKVDKKSRPKSVDKSVPTPENAAPVTVTKTKGKKEKVDKKSRSKSAETSVATPENGAPVTASKTKKKEKTKAPPPSRKNPNAPAFAHNSIITNVPTTPNQPPSPPPTAMNHILIKTNPQVNRNEVSNGSLPAPRSPVPVKTPKTKLPKGSKKNRPVSLPQLVTNQNPVIVPQMSPIPKSQGPTSPVPIVTSPDFEETGIFTFQNRRDSPEPYDMPPSFLYGGVMDDEECDA